MRLTIVVGTTLTAMPVWSRDAAPTTEPTSRPAPLTAGDHLRSLRVDGRRRLYLVHVPPSYDPARPTPLVVAFHGALMNGAMMPQFSGLSEKSDAAGFVVAYPYGVGFGQAALFFNASVPVRANGGGPPDDVKFTDRLLDDVATMVNVDPRRIFATGMSNGGMMTHRVAAELSTRFAAAAPVAGTLALPAIRPARPVPIIMFHGSVDGIVPFAGPAGQTPMTMRFRSVEDSIDSWRKADGCVGPGRTTTIADVNHDNTTVEITTYGPGIAGAEVELVTVKGGGHTWPGRQPPVAFIGVSTTNVSANDLMWDFFCRHPMPAELPAKP